MAAAMGLLVIGRRLGLGLGMGRTPRRALWGGHRKEEKEVGEDNVIPQEKKEPSLICPPPRSRKYFPPEDIQSILEARVKEICGPSLAGNWQQTSLKDNRLKYQLLAQLAEELGHAVPNSQLHLMCSAQDVLTFYSTPVKDMSKFDELCAAELPPNLKIAWER
ncbi:39S ribosomal protein L50, mitochondrial isoform X2 [Meleagris gallopavo]|uniref:39S ribosomal protein L50, mitochondrial isoform X2 n=1 Tax=Meleagris gallopavo TaxID=9103 RepID=UPI000549D5FF|nr:39S ribosomal protein L50, mitochondrial isoform X2 [Meleagris gallopavo]